MDLIGEILDSGTNAIGVTRCDPKTYGETAFDEALRAVLADAGTSKPIPNA